MGTGGGASHRATARTFGHMPTNLTGFRDFATQREAINWNINHNFAWNVWNAMTPAERTGIEEYTGNLYGRINTALREGHTPSPGLQNLIDGTTAGLSRFRAAENMMAYRGANLHWTANLLGGTEAQMSDPAFLRSRIGRTVVDKGFMSSGTHTDSAWYADVRYTIFVHKGISGMYVDPISLNSGEYEFLFNRDTSFRVHQIKTNDRGRIVELVLEAVRSKH